MSRKQSDELSMELIQIRRILPDGSRIETEIEREDPDEEARIAQQLGIDFGATATASAGEAVALFPTPEGCTWQDVHIRVTDNETVAISARGISKKFNFAQLGFQDARKGNKPDKQWFVLVEVLGPYGAVPSASTPGSHDLTNLKKAVSLLRGRLKAILGITDDPFHPYRSGEGWQPKFTASDARLGEGLTTEERLRGGGRKPSDPFWSSDGDDS